jgi:hypothetical protein
VLSDENAVTRRGDVEQSDDLVERTGQHGPHPISGPLRAGFRPRRIVSPFPRGISPSCPTIVRR